METEFQAPLFPMVSPYFMFEILIFESKLFKNWRGRGNVKPRHLEKVISVELPMVH